MYENASNKWSNHSTRRPNWAKKHLKRIHSWTKKFHVIVEEEKEKAKPQTKAQACEETKRVPLDPLVPDKQVIIDTKLSQQEEDKLVEFIQSNKDIFA
jgi:hypothetical protein